METDKLIIEVRKISIATVVFLGVILIMCFVAGLMIRSNEESADTEYREALGKLSGSDGADSGEKGTAAGGNSGAAVPGSEASSQTGGAGTESNSKADNNSGSGAAEASNGQGKQNNDGLGTEGGDAQNGSADDITQTEPVTRPEGVHTVAIDAAHQEKADTDMEPIGPGATTTSMKCKWGATGVASGVPEHKLNLAVAGKLKNELEARGYQVYMLRETSDVSLSDAERARLANVNADIVIHIHANADDREGISGIMAFYPSEDNLYVASLSASCRQLEDKLLTGLAAITGAKNWGTIAIDTLTALNWTSIPAAHVEVGYLSNTEEDRLLQTEDYQQKIATGLADGVDAYFANSSGN